MTALIVGLTGGIGSGKSAATDRFAQLGAAVVDADTIAHELTGPDGGAMAELKAVFGNGVIAPDGRLDRAAMRHLVFADAAARVRLETVLHPMIRSLSSARCSRALADGAPYVLLAVPLLVESGDFRRRVSRIVVVDCNDELRIARVAARSGLDRAQILAIMATQASREQRLAAADDIIRNDGSLADLHTQVDALHHRYSAMAKQA